MDSKNKNDILKEKLEKLDNKASLNDFQKYIEEMVKIRGFQDETPKDVMILLTEEIGELAKEIRKSSDMKFDVSKERKLKLEDEIADVFMYILCMCRVKNVDLAQAFQQKEEKNMNREWK